MKSKKVFDYIRSMIIQKKWTTGEKITSEIKLSEELEVSRISVREAIGSLVTLNILERKRGGGTFVKELTTENYMDQLMPLLTVGDVSYLEVLETRLALDAEAVSLFVNNASEKEIKELKGFLDKMKNSKDDPDEFYKMDYEFHLCISKYSGNRLIYKITNMLFDMVTNCAKKEYHSLAYEERIKEHELILKAIENRDLELSSLYIGRHIKRTIKDLKCKF